MPDIKTRTQEGSSLFLSDHTRAPRELAERMLYSTADQAYRITEPTESMTSEGRYAEEQVEQYAKETADFSYHQGKTLIRQMNHLTQQHHGEGGTEMIRSSSLSAQEPSLRSSSHSESTIVRQGRERMVKNLKNARHAQRSAEASIRAAKSSTEAGIKCSRKSIKTAEQTVKSVNRSIRTAEKTAKAARKAAEASTKASRAAAKAAQQTAKASVATAKTAGKAAIAITKWIIAAFKALIQTIAAGGWVAVVIIIVVTLIALLLGSAFGVFFANDTPDGSRPMTAVIAQLNAELSDRVQNRIVELTEEYEADIVEVIYENDSGGISAANWPDVLAVYAAMISMGENDQQTAVEVTDERIRLLRRVFFSMNPISYECVTQTVTTIRRDDKGEVVRDENGDIMMDKTVTLTISIFLHSQDYMDGAYKYGFNRSQIEVIREMVQPDYYPFFMELTGEHLGDGGAFGYGYGIKPDLPKEEIGAQIVEAAKRYIGRSYDYMDCSDLISAAYRDCGLYSMRGMGSSGQALRCIELGVFFTDASLLQTGDIIFFARKDPVRGKGYCTDTKRCGTGLCKRYLQIHHVAIYINSEFLIDSTGGNNSVQIRKLWGKSSDSWAWVGYGRPRS